jgi:hypothetical protein
VPGVLFVGFVDRFWEGIKVGEFEGASEDMGRTEREWMKEILAVV